MDTNENKELSIVEQAKELIEIADKTLLLKYREKYYKEAIDLLKSDEQTSEVKMLISLANKKLHTARAKGIISKYKECQKEEKMYSSPKDLDSVGNHYASTAKLIESTKIDEKYLSDDLIEKLHECNNAGKKAKELHKRSKNIFIIRRALSLAIVIIIAAAIVGIGFANKTAAFHVLVGKVLNTAGMEEKAKNQFLEAYNDYDSKDGYDLYTSMLLNELDEKIEKNEWSKATSVCKKLHEIAFNDFEDKLIVAEKNRIATAEFGDKVYFGGADWFLADKDGNHYLLIRKNALTPEYSEVFTSKSADTSWETSSIRAYLNSAFYDESFSSKEKELILESSVKADRNSVYKGVKANDTKDKVFILSVSELNDYTDYINKTTKSGWWTRTPGANEGTLVYVDTNKNILYYGYEITEESIKMKPVIWVDISE